MRVPPLLLMIPIPVPVPLSTEDDIFYTDPPFLQLAEYASRYGEDYDQFVDDIERAKAQLVYTPPFEDDGQGDAPDELWKRPVHLMTALRAKGKGFDTVVLLDVIEGIWPNRNAKTAAQLEAERQVFYVAFTRATKNIVMLVNKRIGKDVAVPSPYIEELGLPFVGRDNLPEEADLSRVAWSRSCGRHFIALHWPSLWPAAPHGVCSAPAAQYSGRPLPPRPGLCPRPGRPAQGRQHRPIGTTTFPPGTERPGTVDSRNRQDVPPASAPEARSRLYPLP